MNEKNITLVYKNDYQSILSAQEEYSKIKGRLSKKYSLRIFLISLAFISVFETVIYLVENQPDDIIFYIIMFLVMLLTDTGIIFLNRAFNKAQIRNYSQAMYNYGFATKMPKKAVFEENRIFIQSGYSKVSADYSEFDFLISDRMNFIFSFGGDMNIRNIPKINQNPDDLFAIDNLLREKLGDKFIYKM